MTRLRSAILCSWTAVRRALEEAKAANCVAQTCTAPPTTPWTAGCSALPSLMPLLGQHGARHALHVQQAQGRRGGQRGQRGQQVQQAQKMQKAQRIMCMVPMSASNPYRTHSVSTPARYAVNSSSSRMAATGPGVEGDILPRKKIGRHAT